MVAIPLMQANLGVPMCGPMQFVLAFRGAAKLAELFGHALLAGNGFVAGLTLKLALPAPD